MKLYEDDEYSDAPFYGFYGNQQMRSRYKERRNVTSGELRLHPLSIDVAGFSENQSIKKVIFPRALMRISESAFEGCKNLAQVDFNSCDNLYTIGNRAFKDCVSLKKIDTSVAEIGVEAFSGCSSLEYVVLDGIQNIQKNAFAGCDQIQTFILSSFIGNQFLYDIPNIFGGHIPEHCCFAIPDDKEKLNFLKKRVIGYMSQSGQDIGYVRFLGAKDFRV